MKIKRIALHINDNAISLNPNPPLEIPDGTDILAIIDRHTQAIFEEIKQKEVKK